MKKLLFVMHTMGFGGAERSLVNLLYELPRDRYEVDILLFQKKGALLQQLPQWVCVLDTPEDLNRLYGLVSQAGKLAFAKIFGTACGKMLRRTSKSQKAFRWKYFYKKHIEILQKPYDVAIAYGGAELMYLVIDRIKADKKLIWIHNDYRTGQYSAEDDRPYLEKADGIVSISQACVDVLKQEFPEFSNKMYLVENITSSGLLRKRAEQFIPQEYLGNVCNLLSIGRLWEQKGFDMAVDAAALLKKSGCTFCWYIIGEGHLRKKLEKRIREKNVEDCFVLLGTRSNPYPYIKKCTILVQPSRYEGKSVVLDEAKILGTPIVATAYPTVFDQIHQDKEGVITQMNAQSIAEGILMLVQCPERMDEIRSYLRSQEYGNAAEVQKYINIIEN